MNIQDYKIKESKVLFEKGKVRVSSREIGLPNGNTVDWSFYELPNMMNCVVIQNKHVILEKEYRAAPNNILTRLPGARCVGDNEEDNLKELARELKEELGIESPKFKLLTTFQNGVHQSGKRFVYLVEEFLQADAQREENELLEIILIPISGLYAELSKNHNTTADLLLIAKLLEERY